MKRLFVALAAMLLLSSLAVSAGETIVPTGIQNVPGQMDNNRVTPGLPDDAATILTVSPYVEDAPDVGDESSLQFLQ